MRFSRRLLIFAYGLFSIAAQSLLFREFITAFEGNDISVGVFFGTWFLWVGVGAIFVYRAHRIADKLLENIELLLLGYLPAFILELILIIQGRELAGIESYTLLSVKAIVLLSVIVNAPVSIVTGMFFPIACRWVRQERNLAVSRVYITEAAGSFIGGVGVTVLLGLGVSSARIFLVLAFIISVSTFVVALAKMKRYPPALPRRFSKIKAQFAFLILLCVVVCLVLGTDKTLMRYVRRIKWTKLLPSDALAGSFQTAQAEYLHGVYQGQWIAVREGGVVEALPDEESAGRIAALSLCQNPGARRILVIGSGLGVCREFLRLPQTEGVTWVHCDIEYVEKIDRFIPDELKITDERFYRFAGDVRPLLAEKKQYYDIVILNLPDVTSSVLNRYYTLEFYHQVKDSLNSEGVLAVRIAGGENIMGTELISLGASTKLTLERVFSKLVLTPGKDSWFIGSDSEKLTGRPGILRDRFAKIEGADDIFAPEALLSVYLPGRAASALEAYGSADLPEEHLINRDSKPLTHLYSLLLTAKQSGAPGTKIIKYLILGGVTAFIIPVLVFAALRVIYILRTAREGKESGFDSAFLVFSAGWIGIGVVIVLMYLYQTRFGSLYLHIGVISSIFMIGLTIGAVLISQLVAHKELQTKSEILLFTVIFLQALILTGIIFWPSEEWTHFIFAIGFALCGLCVGSYFPLAAKQLADCGFEAGQAGSKLETADHLGASVGGLVTSLVLVPVLGTRVTLFVFILLIAANLPAAVLKIYKAGAGYSLDTFSFKLRRAGYVLFGVGVTIVLSSNLLASAGARLSPLLPQYTAQALAGELRIEQASAIMGESGREVRYFKAYEPVESISDDTIKEKLAGYIFSSGELAPEVRGFGGKMNLGVYVDTDGKLINYHIIWSNETPAYLRLLDKWRGQLNGRGLFGSEPFADVQAVTGATVSCKAIVSALEKSASRFGTGALGRSLQAGATVVKGHRVGYTPDIHGIYLISAFVLSLLVIYRGGFWSRMAILFFNLVVGGIILNAQYSSEQIASILSLNSPGVGLTGAFLLVVGVPILVIVFGNIYCGYICPFGAVQELLGYVAPGKIRQSVSKERMRKARFVKYVVGFVLIMVFFLSRDRTTLAAEPLISIFNLRFTAFDIQSLVLLIAAIALIGAVFYTRFWCRYLCPVGAFLSLLNKAAILRRYLPAKRFGRCEFGLSPKDQTDCLYCDRCRYIKEQPMEIIAQAPKKGLSRYFITAVLIAAVFVSAVSVSRYSQVIGAGYGETAISVSAGGQPRDVDLQRIRTMIEQGKLSDREAQFYKKLE